ncbi:protein-tyrosine-phosphatase [Kribbella amoyensis]|uniref:Protein-tyrosine-phosphatase n=2 Tax=Kribbella amoyensis TaxID=996641 RepID=A0A561BZE0_9ACTN|nr:protein-tyrosine-phosphatase [Kribbella amoyensis]
MTELARSDLRVRELVGIVDEPQNLVSYHLKLLRDGGLVTSRRSSFDGRDTYYHLDLARCAEELEDLGTALHPALRMTPVPTPPPRKTTGSSVLFVCSGNSARSPIAEALLRHHAGTHLRVASAGTKPKDAVHPHAVRVLREHYDLDITRQRPRAIGSAERTRFGHTITLCDKAREALPPTNGQRAHWSIPDPAAGRRKDLYPEFVAVAAEIDARVRQLLPSLSTTGDQED